MELLKFFNSVATLETFFQGGSDKLLAVPKVNFIIPEFVGPKFGDTLRGTNENRAEDGYFRHFPPHDKVSLNELQIYDDGMLQYAMYYGPY